MNVIRKSVILTGVGTVAILLAGLLFGVDLTSPLAFFIAAGSIIGGMIAMRLWAKKEK